MLQDIYIGIIVVILLILFYCFYVSWKHDVQLLETYENKLKLIKKGIMSPEMKEYKNFMAELNDDLKRHNISNSDKEALYKLMQKIMFEEIAGQKSIFKKVVNSTFYGLMQGGATGFITGGLPGALGGAVVFGTVAPIIRTYQEISPSDENLIEGFSKA